MKIQILKMLIILLVIFSFTACSNNSSGSRDLTPASDIKLTPTLMTAEPEDEPTPMPTMTAEPEDEPTPTPAMTAEPENYEPTPTLEVLVELTEQQEQEIRTLAESYPYIESDLGTDFIGNSCGRIIVAYYVCMGRTDKKLSVVAMVDKEEAVDVFGGEWTEITMESSQAPDCSYGELTVEQIEDTWLHNSEIDLFVDSVSNVDYTGMCWDCPPDAPLNDTIKSIFVGGDVMVYQHDGKWYMDLSIPA